MKTASSRKRILHVTLAVVALGLVAMLGLFVFVFGGNTPHFEGERAAYITPDASLETVVDSLLSAGVMESGNRFRTIARATGWGDQIKAGRYTFEEGASTYEILQKLRRGLQTPVRVVIPPGSRPEVVAAVVAKEMAFDADDFLRALSDDSLAAELGTDTAHLFAYMVPETYHFYWLNEPETVVRRVKEHADDLLADLARSNPHELELTRDQALNVASIVEWETDLVEEKPVIAGVYLNRLRDGWRLQADPTVQYAVISEEGQKRRLYFRDYDITHPYNTYRRDGLPPGPVTNPSPTSVRAVVDAEEHDYYFFVARGDGSHIFSRTLREHNQAAADYRRRISDAG